MSQNIKKSAKNQLMNIFSRIKIQNLTKKMSLEYLNFFYFGLLKGWEKSRVVNQV